MLYGPSVLPIYHLLINIIFCTSTEMSIWCNATYCYNMFRKVFILDPKLSKGMYTITSQCSHTIEELATAGLN